MVPSHPYQFPVPLPLKFFAGREDRRCDMSCFGYSIRRAQPPPILVEVANAMDPHSKRNWEMGKWRPAIIFRFIGSKVGYKYNHLAGHWKWLFHIQSSLQEPVVNGQNFKLVVRWFRSSIVRKSAIYLQRLMSRSPSR